MNPNPQEKSSQLKQPGKRAGIEAPFAAQMGARDNPLLKLRSLGQHVWLDTISRGVIDLIGRVKARHALKVVALINEGRELTIHRIEHFNLRAVIDFFVSSCFVQRRKPDHDIYRIALDCAQEATERLVHIDDRDLYIEVAGALGVRSIHHNSCDRTRAAPESYGLGA